jgi:hypothetical protein
MEDKAPEHFWPPTLRDPHAVNREAARMRLLELDALLREAARNLPEACHALRLELEERAAAIAMRS